jgi:hypothetical protein
MIRILDWPRRGGDLDSFWDDKRTMGNNSSTTSSFERNDDSQAAYRYMMRDRKRIEPPSAQLKASTSP